MELTKLRHSTGLDVLVELINYTGLGLGSLVRNPGYLDQSGELGSLVRETPATWTKAESRKHHLPYSSTRCVSCKGFGSRRRTRERCELLLRLNTTVSVLEERVYVRPVK